MPTQTQPWLRAELIAAPETAPGAQLMIPADTVEFHDDQLVFHHQGDIVYVAPKTQLRSITWFARQPNPETARRKAQWPNHGTRWTAEERQDLLHRLTTGTNWKAISHAHGRSRTGCQQEAVKQGWVDPDTLRVKPELLAGSGGKTGGGDGAGSGPAADSRTNAGSGSNSLAGPSSNASTSSDPSSPSDSGPDSASPSSSSSRSNSDSHSGSRSGSLSDSGSSSGHSSISDTGPDSDSPSSSSSDSGSHSGSRSGSDSSSLSSSSSDSGSSSGSRSGSRSGSDSGSAVQRASSNALADTAPSDLPASPTLGRPAGAESAVPSHAEAWPPIGTEYSTAELAAPPRPAASPVSKPQTPSVAAPQPDRPRFPPRVPRQRTSPEPHPDPKDPGSSFLSRAQSSLARAALGAYISPPHEQPGAKSSVT